MHELQTTENNQACFITLTYDDNHLPKDHSLNKEHFQDFLKRFRKSINKQYGSKINEEGVRVPVNPIRYFMAGEYGDHSWRPHYHAILFGYDFTEPIEYRGELHQERKQLQYLQTDNPYYISSYLSALWPFGNHIITNCTYETAAYTARYVVKKVTGEQAEDHYNRFIWEWNEFTGEIYNMQEVNLQPEYATMSRGGTTSKGKAGGIGSKWFEKYKSDCYPSNYLIHNGSKLPIPKYYDTLLEREDETLLAQVKINRELALAARAADLTPEMLKKRLYYKEQQTKTLKRGAI